MRFMTIAADVRQDFGAVIELEKWERYYKSVGVSVVSCRGKLDVKSHKKPEGRVVLQSIAPDYPPNLELMRSILPVPRDSDFEAIDSRIEQLGAKVYKDLRKLIDTLEIDLIHVDAALSYPICLPLAFAVSKLAQRDAMPVVGRDHDFIEHRPMRTNPYMRDHISWLLPVINENILHLTLTEFASRFLLQRHPLANVVDRPNLFDFDAPARPHNPAQWRKSMGIPAEALVIVQPTRCLRTKGVHRAIQLASRLREADRHRPVTLVVTGSSEGGMTKSRSLGNYRSQLNTIISAADIDVLFCEGNLVRCDRANHETEFCINDAYLAANLITYFSVAEGFGNPVVESVAARKPLCTAEYPVMREEFMKRGLEFDSVAAEQLGAIPSESSDFDTTAHWLTDSYLSTVLRTINDLQYADQRQERNWRIAMPVYGEAPDSIARSVEPALAWARKYAS